MAVIQMTRAEYQTKYGVAPTAPVSAVDTAPAPVKMTRAEYELKYGTPVASPPPVFGNPAQTIKSAGEDVNAAISGTGQYQGKSPIERGFSAASSAALAVPTVAADVIPGGKAALGAVSDIFGKGISLAGNIPNTLADIAQKAGIMSKEQRLQYDKNNGAFANSPVGAALDSTASVLNSAGNIANVILGAHGTAQAVQNFIDKGVPAIQEKVATMREDKAASQQQSAVQAQANEIAAVEAKYAKGRKANLYSKDEGSASRERIAQTNVLENAVNQDGLIQTTNKGGAVDQYKAMTVKPAEGVVRAKLVQEGSFTPLTVVEQGLKNQISSSGLEGADLVSALNGIKREMAGLRLKADANGNIPNAILQDAKINTTNNINYLTPPETATYRKAIARGYKTLIEENSGFNVKAINEELAKYYDDIARLERLDGLRVSGGRLGKYTAQISGNIVGGAIGGLFGGPAGIAIGTVVGGETAGLIKGKNMGRTFNKGVKGITPKSAVLDAAVSSVKKPR